MIKKHELDYSEEQFKKIEKERQYLEVPLQRNYNFQEIGRSLFKAQELPKGVLARYEKQENIDETKQKE